MAEIGRRHLLSLLLSVPACGPAARPRDVELLEPHVGPSPGDPESAKLELVFQWGYAETPTALALSPDGQTLAAGYSDGGLVLWRLSDGVVLHRRRTALESVAALAFSPEGRQLAIVGQGGGRIYNLASGRETTCPAGRDDQVASRVVFGRLGGEVAMVAGDRVYVVDASTGAPRTEQPLVAASIKRASIDKGTLPSRPEFESANTLADPSALSPDGAMLAVPHDDAVTLFDWRSGASVRTLSSRTATVWMNGQRVRDGALPDATVSDAAWSSSGALASVSGSRIDLWARDLTRLERSVGPDRGEAIERLVWSVDGRAIHVALRDGTLATWNTTDGGPTAALAAPAPLGADALHFSEDGHAVVLLEREQALVFRGDGPLAPAPEPRSTEAAAELLGLPGFLLVHPDAKSWAVDGETLAFVATDGQLTCVNRRTQVILWRAPRRDASGEVAALYFSGDGRLSLIDKSGRAQTFDAATGKAGRRGEVGTFVRGPLVIDPNRTTLALAADHQVQLLDPDTLMVRRVLDCEGVSICWSPDSTRLVVASADGVVTLWDVKTGRGGRLRFSGSLVAWSPDGSILAASHEEGVSFYRLRDSALLQLVRVPTRANAWFAFDQELRMDGDTSHVRLRDSALHPTDTFTLEEVEGRTGAQRKHPQLLAEFLLTSS